MSPEALASLRGTEPGTGEAILLLWSVQSDVSITAPIALGRLGPPLCRDPALAVPQVGMPRALCSPPHRPAPGPVPPGLRFLLSTALRQAACVF